MAENEPVHVVCAAMRMYDGTLICGARHYDDIMRTTMQKCGFTKYDVEIQGFIDQYGGFLTRQQALEAVKASGQPLRGDEIRCGMLFSQNLY